MTASPAGSLGSLVHDYIDVQCGVILESRTAIEARDEDAVHPVRVAIRRRRFLISAIMPYCFILSLGAGMLIVTLVAGSLQVLGEESVWLFGYSWSLSGVSGVLLYMLGLAGEVLVLTAIYLVMPVGRLSLSHALIGGVTAALLWEVARHILVWYFSTLSQVNVVYGSMTTAIVVMFSLEIGATLLLFGAQVISEFERAGREEQFREPEPLTTPVVQK